MSSYARYSLPWLLAALEAGNDLKYLFFWEHTARSNGEPGNSCFSQWFELSFMVNGFTYPTAEHWMMAGKAELFNDLEIRDRISGL